MNLVTRHLLRLSGGLLGGLAILALVGCQSIKPPLSIDTPELVSPKAVGETWQLTQRLTIHQPNGQQRRLMVLNSLTPERMRLNGLSATGQRLLELQWDGDTLTQWQSAVIEQRIPSVWLLAQIQLAYFPESLLRRHYRGKWSLQADTRKRTLFLEGKSDITVTCRPPSSGDRGCLVPGSSVRIEHHRSGASIDVDTLKVDTVKLSPTGSASAGRPEYSHQ